MERTPIASSNLVSAGYDAVLEILEVEFKGKGNPVYRYRGVPQHIADEFAKAESPGRYLHNDIKPLFACKKSRAPMKKGESYVKQVHVVHMDPVVAAAIKGKPVASLKMAMVLPPESRLYLVESDGGLPTGRADLCTVVGRDGDRLVFERRLCWHQQAPNPLVQQHLEVLPIIYVRLTEANL